MTEQQVKELLRKEGLSWDDFQKWMIGQTLSQNKAGETIYWPDDVQRFVGIKNGSRVDFFD